MLHRVNPPAISPLLTQAVLFERSLLNLIFDAPSGYELRDVFHSSEQTIYQVSQRLFVEKAVRFMNRPSAEWLWERMYSKDKGDFNLTVFGKALKLAVQYIDANPSVGLRILECANNDLEFQNHISDRAFSFFERRFQPGSITEGDLRVFNPLLVGLYENIFSGSGFPAGVHGDNTKGNLKRDDWNRNFWESNSSLHFCPACNGQKPSVVRGSIASDVDHFFPKEKYPLLAIHPDNLIPTCLECNTKAHRSYDPLDDHTTETLLDTFHPIHNPAIDNILLCIESKIGSGIKINILEHDGTRSIRINNLVRVFDLENRWADWFKELINSMLEILQEKSILDRSSFNEYIQDDYENSRRYQSTREKCFVYSNLLSYIINHPKEFEDLCSTFGI